MDRNTFSRAIEPVISAVTYTSKHDPYLQLFTGVTTPNWLDFKLNDIFVKKMSVRWTSTYESIELYDSQYTFMCTFKYRHTEDSGKPVIREFDFVGSEENFLSEMVILALTF